MRNLHESLRNLHEILRNLGEILRNLEEILRNLREILRNLGEIFRNLGEILRNLGETFHIPIKSGYIWSVILRFRVFLDRKICAVTTISDDWIRQEPVGSFPM